MFLHIKDLSPYTCIFLIIIIINEFHRDTSLKQNFRASDLIQPAGAGVSDGRASDSDLVRINTALRP